MITRLKYERMKTGFKQVELAKKTNINPTVLCALEGRKIVADTRHRELLEEALEIPAAELFEDNGLARLQ